MPAPLPGSEGLHWGSLAAAFVQIVLIDLTLASDNAVAIGMAAMGLPREKRHLAFGIGLGGAVVLLCALAFFAIKLLQVGGGGLVLAGGLLLLLVSRQMFKDLRAHQHHHREHPDAPHPHKTLRRALALIFIADVSTSLDNVLAITGVARGQPWWLLFIGLALSVGLTGFAAAWVTRLLHRWPWIGYIGLFVVLIVALRMIWDGSAELGWLRPVGIA